MTGILVTGGAYPERKHVERWLSEAALIVAADSGFDTARALGVEPDLVVGDMDSIGNRQDIESLPSASVRIYPTDKDYTDTELGLQALADGGADRIIMIGGGGGRVDHFIGILALFDRDSHPALWVLPNAEVHSVEGRWRMHGAEGEIVSFFPAGTDTCSMVSRGLKWQLDGLVWQKGDAGVSNVVSDTRIEVDMLSGRLIMVRNLEV